MRAAQQDEQAFADRADERTVEVPDLRPNLRGGTPEELASEKSRPSGEVGEFVHSEAAAHPQAYHPDARRRLWELSEQLAREATRAA